MKTIVIEVFGGVVQEVYADTKDVRVVKIDWDAGESSGDAFIGGEFPTQLMASMPRDTRLAFVELAEQ